MVSLFTGAGGLDLGLEAAGYSTVVAVEYNAPACRTLRANTSDSRRWDVVERSVHELPSEEILERSGVQQGEIDLLVGGPPCQPFSKSAYWAKGDTARLGDPRADTLSAYLRILRDLRPKAYLLENVFGLTYKGKDEALRLLKTTVDRINADVGTNYSFTWAVLNTADYGVPQMRERFFLVGLRDGAQFKFPSPTHADLEDAKRLQRMERRRLQVDLFSPPDGAIQPWTTAWDAIGDLQDVEHSGLQVTGKWADLLPSIPEGLNYLHHTSRGDGLPLFGWRRRYWSFLLKLSKRRPSWTVQAQPGAGIGPFHWKSRRLSVQEMMRIQTFPDGYQIVGGHTEAQRQLGNAVPSLMAETLGRALGAQLRGACGDLANRSLLPRKRVPIPPAEIVTDVPSKFRSLVGDHAPHPGTGRGRGAVRGVDAAPVGK